MAYNRIVNFAEIKRRREKLGMTQIQAARKAGWTTIPAWAGMEAGRRPDPQVSTLLRVANALGCTVNDLLYKSDAGLDTGKLQAAVSKRKHAQANVRKRRATPLSGR